jgi:hypothetical protein
MPRGSWSRYKLAICRKTSRKPAVTDPRNYEDYVGKYEWRPGGETDVISLKNGKLWSEFDGDEDEYLPIASDTFFIANDLGSVTFTRDGSGPVTGYTYDRVDGQEIQVRRVR